MIVDCHCYAGRGDGLTGPWDTAAPLAKYLRHAARAGIDRTVIFAAFHSDYAAANDEVACIIISINSQWPDRFYGFAFVHAERDRGRVHSMVERAIVRYGFCGIKLHGTTRASRAKFATRRAAFACR
jgi:predicted TIM-barrel fold metal-dependent hydrolase